MSALTVVDTPMRRSFFGAGLAFIGAIVYREVAPYQRSTSNVLNLVVQYQIFAVFVYASLLLTTDGTAYTGVLAGIDGETAGGVMALVNLR